jgi:hypothetical protein
MMPMVRCTLASWARRLAPPTAIFVLLALLPTACSDDQPTEPRTDTAIRPNLALSCTETCFRDNFTDTDGTLLENHTPDGGGSAFAWIQTATGPFANQKVAEIRGNAVVPFNQEFPQSGAHFNYLTNVVTGDAAEVEVELPTGSSTDQYDVAIGLRNQDGTGFNNYNIIWSIGGFNGDALGSILTIDGPNSNLAYVNQSLTRIPAGTYKLGAEVLEGGIVNAYIDGSLIATATVPSTSRLPPGRVGLNLFFTHAPPIVRVTSFTATQGDQPPAVRIEPANGSMEVWPEKTAGSAPLDLKIGVYSAQGTPVPNSTVTLTLTPTQRTAGHDHEGTKPAGRLSVQNPVPTGATGEVTVKYTAPTPSGPVTIRGTSSGAQEAVKTINVGVPGLVTIARSGEHFTFQSSSRHASNDFYMAPGAMDVMTQIWNAWVNTKRPIMPSKKFTITAATLISGGLYDIEGNWTTSPGHVWHRQGGDMDFDDPLAEAKWLEMKKLCAKFDYQGQPVDCQRHGLPDHIHFHAVLGPNR